jgi:8-oxo-dGTP pyrophosphatase MutT (NUDIX family)
MGLPEFSIVVPVYNEGENIGGLLRGLEKDVPGEREILICYDFDADTTLPAIAAMNPPVAGVRLVRNDLGKGVVNAIRAGFKASRGRLGVVVTMADLSDPPDRIPALVERLRAGDDVVAGSRYMKGGRQIGGPPLKGFLSRLAGTLAWWFTGIGIHDVTTNFRAYSRRLVEEVPIESKGGFELGLELTVKAHLAGWRVGEVPSDWHDRTAGQSRFKLFAWLPGYLRWYLRLFLGDPLGLNGRLRRQRSEFPRAGSYRWFGVYEKPGYGWLIDRPKLATIVAARDPSGGLVMVRQWRPIHAEGESDWEMPGGAAEANEDPITAAARELEEETGFRPLEPGRVLGGELEPIPGMGKFTHRLILFPRCEPTGRRQPEEDPGIREVRVMSDDEIRRRIGEGEIRAQPTLAGLALLTVLDRG